jgi:lipoprotein-releasing system permease protein
MTGKGKLAGVLVNGVDPKTVTKVLNIHSRLISGKFKFGKKDSYPLALVGKSLARRFELKIGQPFKVVLPMPERANSTGFTPKVMTFVLGGTLDLGKAEYDERMVVTDLASAQAFAEVGDAFGGIRIKLSDSNLANRVSARIASELGGQYWTMDWTEVNRNLFDAVKIERVVIFFVILVMVIAASFNIASNLFVSVLKKYPDISILRAMGFSGKDVKKVFLVQGLFYGLIGTAAGLLLGLGLCYAFVVAQRHFVLLPVEAYRIDHVGIDLRLFDLIAIVVSALLICLFSTYIPARRGALLDPVEGLRYE